VAATIKNLAEGQLPNSKTTLYTVPALTSAVVLNVVCVNKDTVTRTHNLYYKKSGGTSRLLTAENQQIQAKYKSTVEEKITMGAGDQIEGDASAATIVDYVISGVERT
jgi:hypothetical protein